MPTERRTRSGATPASRSCNNFAQKSVKCTHNWKKKAKGVTFSVFYLYLCHVLLKVFLCLIFRSTKISEILDMTNTCLTFCCPSYSKKYFLTMLRILGYWSNNIDML
jgi:hypothetical protein